MKKKRVSVTKESQSGRNEQFVDNITGQKMSRVKFVHKIKRGEYKDYYTKKINGLDTPVSKPDGDKSNNLG